MTTETVLTDEQIASVPNSEADMPEHRPMLDYARAIEQAVLQSPEVQRMREDAGRYRALRSAAVIGDLGFVRAAENYALKNFVDQRNPTQAEFDSGIDAAMEKQ